LRAQTAVTLPRLPWGSRVLLKETAIFPLVHLYFAGSVLGPLTDAEILGAILPDALILAGISWEDSHAMGPRLYRYAVARQPHLTGMARAALTHGASPPGLDYFGDKSCGKGHPGFAFRLGSLMASRAAGVCRLPEDLGLWKAHNFVEMAAEVIVSREHSQLAGRLRQVLVSSFVLEPAAGLVAAALEVERDAVAAALRRLPGYLELGNISPRRLAAKYQLQLNHRHGVKGACLEDLEELINDCIPLVEPRLEAFLDKSRREVQHMLEGYPLPAG